MSPTCGTCRLGTAESTTLIKLRAARSRSMRTALPHFLDCPQLLRGKMTRCVGIAGACTGFRTKVGEVGTRCS
jgi:hypothetical protein